MLSRSAIPSVASMLVAGLFAPGPVSGQSPVEAKGSYKGYGVTAIVKGKGIYGSNGTKVRDRSNHIMRVEVVLVRSESTPTDLVFPMHKGKPLAYVYIPTKELELRGPAGVYPSLAIPGLEGVGIGFDFDKTFTRGKGTFDAVVPAATVCSTLNVRMGESVFAFDQSTYPKNCE